MREKDVITPGTENYTPHLWLSFTTQSSRNGEVCHCFFYLLHSANTHKLTNKKKVGMAEVSLRTAKDIKAIS